MRNYLIFNLMFTYLFLGTSDCWDGNWKTGIASLLLAAVNGLLFWQA